MSPQDIAWATVAFLVVLAVASAFWTPWVLAGMAAALLLGALVTHIYFLWDFGAHGTGRDPDRAGHAGGRGHGGHRGIKRVSPK